MARTSVKGGAMGLAMVLITAGVQQAIAGGEPIVGGALIIIGGAIGLGYQLAEDHDHGDVYNDVVDSIGEDNFRELANFTAGQLRQLREEIESESDDST